jgi:hypothetical protein
LALRIRDWDRLFENSTSRKLKRLDWVAVPNKTDGEGYMELVDHPDGAAHLGAWYAIVECASKQKARGNLPGISQDVGGICRAIGKISQLPASVFLDVVPRLLKIGWLEEYVDENQSITESPTSSGENPSVLGENPRHIEGNRREGKGTTAAAQENPPMLMAQDLRPQTEYPETLRVIRGHDASVDPFFVQRLADQVAREIISDPLASQWPIEKQRKAVSDALLAKACREVYATPRKKPPGTGLLLTTVPRILIGGKTNYV